MSLSKQLYIIISLIFFMIFTGNFIISVTNTQEYLQIESVTKAQDTATSLGMTLKPLLKDKTNPEIESILRAVSNRGFYKEIRLEDTMLTFSDTDIIEKHSQLSNDKPWTINEVAVDEKYGFIELPDINDEFNNELLALNDELDSTSSLISPKQGTYSLVPSKTYKNGGTIPIKFSASLDNTLINDVIALELTHTLVKITRDVKFDHVPQWFIDWLPIDLPEQKSEITNGWNTTATIYVSANPGEAYSKLYEQTQGAIYYALAAFLISMVCLFIFLQFILQPLRSIEKLASSIAQGKFDTIKKLPWTTEIKNVALAMNDMSTKIESVMTKLNKNLEQMTHKLSIDELTGLSLKQTFETDMKKMFISKSEGYILSIKIEDLGSFAKTNTPKTVNEFIKTFAQILKQTHQEFEGTIDAYRFYGSEFAMIARNFNYDQTQQLTLTIQKAFNDLSKQFEKRSIGHIGATPFNPIGTTPEILNAANEAYQTAKQIGPNETHIRNDKDLARDMESWKVLVSNIINESNFIVEYIHDAFLLSNSQKVIMKEAFTQVKDTQNNTIPIGTFVSIAEKYNTIIDFDQAVIKKVIEYIKQNDIQYEISINLSLDSIQNSQFIQWLKTTITKKHKWSSLLVFSITAYSVAKNLEQFKQFVEEVHRLGSKIIVKRFETKFIPLDTIKNLNLDYIRLARNYTTNIANDPSKQNFVEALQELSVLLNIKVFAEDVKNNKDFDYIKGLNLYGTSR